VDAQKSYRVQFESEFDQSEEHSSVVREYRRYIKDNACLCCSRVRKTSRLPMGIALQDLTGHIGIGWVLYFSFLKEIGFISFGVFMLVGIYLLIHNMLGNECMETESSCLGNSMYVIHSANRDNSAGFDVAEKVLSIVCMFCYYGYVFW
jgi:hypothetical protein